MSAEPSEPWRDQRHLFEQYQATGDAEVRAQLVSINLRLATHLARRFANRGLSTDDLEQVAALALLRAIDRFDPSRGLEFSTFATPTILGELKRHFRDRGWAVRVPRRVQELHLRLNSLVVELTQLNGRNPTIAELALASGSSEEEVLEAMEAAQAYRSRSIDHGDSEGEPMELRLGSDDEDLFRAEDRVIIDELLRHLPAREQLMLRLRYYDELTQAQIADRLSISQMHVSRLLQKSVAELRRRARDQR